MDEYLSEKEQIERLRQFWRENGWYIIAGVVVGAALLFGWNRYGAYQERQAQTASGVYDSLREAAAGGREDDAKRLLAQLREEYPSSPYVDQGEMLLARMVLIAEPDEAIAQLRRVVESSQDPQLALVARLRLARVLAYREQYQEALSFLDVDEPDSYTARFSEIEGDIQNALGNHEAAREAYQRALTAPPGEFLIDRNFVQMKLDDLPPVAMPPMPSGEGGS